MKRKTKKESFQVKITYIILTILFAILFCILKLFSLGWLTVIFFYLFVAYILFYIINGILFANTPNKDDKDYKTYWISTIFFLLSALIFCDGGDYGPPNQILTFLSVNASLQISLISIVISIIAGVLNCIHYNKKK